MHTDNETVVVIGAGMAGLTAAATAARAGRPVVVVEGHAGGGRARTDERRGYRFNQGAHALYKGGPAWRILGQLGVSHTGHMPRYRGARGSRDGQLVGLLGAPAATVIRHWVTASPGKWAGRSAEEWIASMGGAEVAELARMLTRVSTYVADLKAMPAEIAILQAKASLKGVSYLDGGWAGLVEGVSAAARAAGATIRTHEAAVAIGRAPASGGWEVELVGGEVLPAASVVIAAGGPANACKLLPVDPGWPEPGPPVTAACLDLGLRGSCRGIVFGLDQPLYLSRHSPPGDLAPAGGSLVHVMRYGARGAAVDRAELRAHARLAGITDEQIVEERFLANMVVTHVLPRPEQGLAGRPGVAVPGADGIYLAGDWVGPTGWLVDAALASGQRAGQLAAGAAVERQACSRVA